MACARSQGKGLEVGEENAGAGDVRFRLLVHAAMDGVVGALEEQALAVGHQLNARVGILRVEIFEAGPRQHHRRGDIVFHLHLLGGVEIGPQLVNAPGAVALITHAQIVTYQLLVIMLQLMAQEAVDAIDGKMLAPVVAPFAAGSSA